MIKLFFLVSLLILTSCSGLQKKIKYAVVDSTYRGLKIYNEDKKILGETPFFFPAKSQSKYQFFYKEKSFWKKAVLKCKKDLSPDFLVEGVRRCHQYFIIKNSLKIAQESKTKKTLVLFNEDISIDESVLAKENLELIDEKKLKNEIKVYGFNDQLDAPLTLEQIEIIKNLGEKYKADAYIHMTKKQDQIIVSIWDIYTQKKIKDLKKIKIEKKEKDSRWARYISGLFNFFPNSIALNYFFQGRVNGKERTSAILKEYGSDKRDVSSHPNSFPRYIPLLSVENIINPYLYKSLDYDISFSPSINAFSFEYKDDLDQQIYVLKLQGYGLFYNFYLNLISPMGTTGFSLGLGAAYIRGKDSQGLDYSKVNALSKGSVTQTVFFTDRLFTQVGINMYSLTKVFEKRNTQVYVPDSYHEYFFSLGYYFPEGKTYTKSLFL